MTINFFERACQDFTSGILFGICDDVPSQRAYLDTLDSTKWVAIVDNSRAITVTFTAIDNCIEIRRADGTTESRCDGMLTFTDNIIFVELKERDVANSIWVKKGEDQLRNMINLFESNHDSAIYTIKKAYLCNKLKPNFPTGQMTRMQKFEDETGYIFVVQQTIQI